MEIFELAYIELLPFYRWILSCGCDCDNTQLETFDEDRCLRCLEDN